MAPPPRFDHDEARELYAAGVSRKELAERYGVSVRGIYRVTAPPKIRARVRAYDDARHRAARVSCATDGCDNLVHGRWVPGRLCRKCWAEARTLNVRAEELRCETCHEWKPDREFPNSRTRRCEHRRSRHGTCRECCTVLRREYRERNKVPCSHGCGTMVLHENGGKEPECHPCAVARIQGDRQKAAA